MTFFCAMGLMIIGIIFTIVGITGSIWMLIEYRPNRSSSVLKIIGTIAAFPFMSTMGIIDIYHSWTTMDVLTARNTESYCQKEGSRAKTAYKVEDGYCYLEISGDRWVPAKDYWEVSER